MVNIGYIGNGYNTSSSLGVCAVVACVADGGCGANACASAGCGANACGADGCWYAICAVNACPLNGCAVDGCILNFTPLPGPFDGNKSES